MRLFGESVARGDEFSRGLLPSSVTNDSRDGIVTGYLSGSGEKNLLLTLPKRTDGSPRAGSYSSLGRR